MMMLFLIVVAAFGAMATATDVGTPKEVDPSSTPVSKEIIAKAQKLGKANNVEIRNYTVNSSTRYPLHRAELVVDGQQCTMTASEEHPVKFLKGDKNCILCC